MLPTLWHAVSLDHGLTIVTDCYLVHLVLFLLLSSVCRTILLVWSYGTRLKCAVPSRTCVSFIGFQSETEYLSKLPHCAITLYIVTNQPILLLSFLNTNLHVPCAHHLNIYLLSLLQLLSLLLVGFHVVHHAFGMHCQSPFVRLIP